MKRFEELNKKEIKSKSQANIWGLINKKTIAITVICIICAFILALLWASIYTNFQRKRLIRMQENTPKEYTISFSVDDITATDNYSSISNDAEMGFTDKNIDDSSIRVDSVNETNNSIESEVQIEEKVDIYGTLDGNMSDKLKIKFSNCQETNSYVAFIFLVENVTNEDSGINFWYESNINEYTLIMKSESGVSSFVIPANGSILMTLKYATDELQYCGISTIEKLRFNIGDKDTEYSDRTKVTFEDLGIKIKETSISDNAINHRIKGELSAGEMSEGIGIDYVGYEKTNSYICLYFDVVNISENYYGFVFWSASQVNKCALKMLSTSDSTGALDGNDHVLMVVKYATDDLKNAGISNINEVIFKFADNSDNKENAATATFCDLDIPID